MLSIRFQILLVLFIMLQMTNSFSAEPICGVVQKTDEGVQVIPKQGKVHRNLKEKTDIACQSQISTHDGVLWFELQPKITVKMGPESFAEIIRKKNSDQVDEYQLHLYRGRALVESAQQKMVTEIVTPQAIVEFKGGSIWVEALPVEKVTQVAAFNRKAVIRNRYHLAAEQEIETGEMTGLAFTDPRVMPRQPKVMSTAMVHEVLSSLNLSEQERADLTEVVARVQTAKKKSLATELSEWKQIEKPQEEGRSLASKTKKDNKIKMKSIPVEVIQAKEAQFAIEHLKNKMMGVDEGQADVSGAEEESAPARSIASSAIPDAEYEILKKMKQSHKKKLLEKLSQPMMDDEE